MTLGLDHRCEEVGAADDSRRLHRMTGALLAATVVVPGSVTALADRVSGPVAAAAVVVGALLLLILVVWLARKVVHKIIGIAVSAGVATATHAGMQTWIHHLISTATHS